MADIINGYVVTSSNRSSKTGQRASIKIRRDGQIMAEVWPSHTNPLRYARSRPQDVDTLEIVRQLRINDVAESDIKAILAVKKISGNSDK
jgi:hypothetical protein